MRNLELPARMSPCLRFFIASLFDEVDGNRSASWVSEARASNASQERSREKNSARS
jgi:hypothetical protein